MKKFAASVIVSILFGLALTFSQVFAAVPEPAALKKTPPSAEGLQRKPTEKDKKATKVSGKETLQATKKSDKPDKPVKPSKTAHPTKTPKSRVGKPVNFRGTITGINASSLDLTLKKGGSQTIDMDGETRIHIPTIGYEDGVDGLTTGMEVSVHAVVIGEGKSPLAKTIHVIPGKPSYIHKPVTVESYTPGVNLTVKTADGSTATFDIDSAKIRPDPNAILQPGDRVTLVFARRGEEMAGTIIAIVIHPSPK